MTTVEDIHPYWTEFPRRLGPPPVPSYQGSDYFQKRSPSYTVTLDAGAFRAVWEIMEAEAKFRYPTRGILKAEQAALRAVESLREAYWKQNEPPEERPAPQKKSARAAKTGGPPKPKVPEAKPPVRRLIRKPKA